MVVCDFIVAACYFNGTRLIFHLQQHQQPATIAVTAAALQYSVSKYIRSLNSLFNAQNNIQFPTFSLSALKVMINGVLNAGFVHSATQRNVNAKRFQNCTIYCKNTYSASSHTPSLLSRDNSCANHDVTPSVAVCTWDVHFRPQATTNDCIDYIVPKLSVATPVIINAALRPVCQKTIVKSFCQ